MGNHPIIRELTSGAVVYRAPFARPGGKNGKIGYALSGCLYRKGIRTYAEPFGGSWGVGRLSAPFERELYIDLDLVSASAIQAFCKDGNAVIRYVLEHIPHTEEAFRELKGFMDNEVSYFQKTGGYFTGDIIKRGTMALALLNMSINGAGKSFKKPRIENLGWWEKTILDKGPTAERFQKVEAVHGDGLEWLREHRQDPSVMVYADPPYIQGNKDISGVDYQTKRTSSRLYNVDMPTQELQEKFLEVVKDCGDWRDNAKIMISGYRSNLYDAYLKPENGWHVYDILSVKKTMAVTKGAYAPKPDAVETIWMNYPVEAVAGE